MGSFRAEGRSIASWDEPINALFSDEEAWNRASLFVTPLPLPLDPVHRPEAPAYRAILEPGYPNAMRVSQPNQGLREFSLSYRLRFRRFRRFQTDSALACA